MQSREDRPGLLQLFGYTTIGYMGRMLHVSIPDKSKTTEIIRISQRLVAMIVEKFLEVALGDPHDTAKSVRYKIAGFD